MSHNGVESDLDRFFGKKSFSSPFNDQKFEKKKKNKKFAKVHEIKKKTIYFVEEKKKQNSVTFDPFVVQYQ